MWFLVGPTAVGKTDLSIELAEALNAEIITADSMQVYRGMDIGTAKPTQDQQARVRHHLIDVIGLSESYDVARYRRHAMEAVADARSRGRQALVVGGSGMYVRALTRGLFEGHGGEKNPEIRKKWMAFGRQKGLTYLHHVLTRIDPASASRIAPADTRRVLRALEYHEITGKPISAIRTQWGAAATSPDVIIGLCRPRMQLYARCNRRVEEMMRRGLVDEVIGIRSELEANPTARHAVGYKEVLAHLRGELGENEMIKQIQQHTRQLAKRQLTWFRREHNLKWIEIEDDDHKHASALVSRLRRLYLDHLDPNRS